MQQIILAIAGKPGLYKLVSRGNNNLIVEALDGTHRRMPAFATERITSLNDIAMFTETDDVPLMDVLENLKNLENGQKASINEKKHQVRSSVPISPRYCPSGIRTVCRTVTLRNSSPGTISL